MQKIDKTNKFQRWKEIGTREIIFLSSQKKKDKCGGFRCILLKREIGQDIQGTYEDSD